MPKRNVVRAILVCCVGCLPACTSSPADKPVPQHRYAAVGTTPTSRVFIVSEAPATETLSSIMANETTTAWWIKIELPARLEDDGALDATFDLSATTSVKFSQNYRDLCDPSANDDRSCWLTEAYIAGDTGLSGEISLKYGEDGLTMSYFVDWQGQTDRFDGPTQWHRHITEGHDVVPTEYVAEIQP
jgi:hypothetical protein